MDSDDLHIRPNIERVPVHPSITASQISALVDSFYDKIRTNERLGPIFNARINDNWPEHLDKMKKFWRSVLQKTGEYKGRPLPPHAQLPDVVSEDYKIWLDLFRETAFEQFTPEAAPVVIATAERIAESFWLGIFSTPFSKAPEWIKSS
ncbi:MAG: group III truncated hemoglobin [Methyloligellaceae bacterium]